MNTTELMVMRLGKSRMLRIPSAVLRRYNIGASLIMELRPNEIVLRPKSRRRQKLTWAETCQQMVHADENWSDWERLPEGLVSIPGEAVK